MKTWHWILIIVGILILLYIWKKKGKESNNGNNGNNGNLGFGGPVGTLPGDLNPQVG